MEAALKLREINTAMSAINKRLRELKRESGDEALKAKADVLRAKLYEYMVENDVEEVGGYTLGYVITAEEKKVQRREKKKEKVVAVLTNCVSEKTAETLADQLLAGPLCIGLTE